MCKDMCDYCLNLLFYLIHLCLLVIDNVKRLTWRAQMMIIRIHLMCGRADVKTSKREMTKYKGFQIVHCLCWHVRCRMSRLKSELHIEYSQKEVFWNQGICLDCLRTIDVYSRTIDFTSRCNHILHVFL